jgi:hypothetical protein
VPTKPKNKALELLTATLAEVAEDYVYLVSCLQCQTNRKFDPRIWLRVKGEGFPISNLSRNYRCGKCRSRNVIIACAPAEQYEEIERRPEAKKVFER